MPRRQRALVALAVLVGLATVLAACARPAPTPAANPGPAASAPVSRPGPSLPDAASGGAQTASAAVGTAGDLAACPARSPLLRVGGVFASEAFSPHPMETRFTSTSYTRLHQLPLFGADPLETKLDPAYGAAESWVFSDDARALR